MSSSVLPTKSAMLGGSWQIGVDALSDKCKACPIRDTCGGGLYAHRYKRGIGYLNPSVYCADLSRLITHIIDRVAKDVLS